MRIKTNRYLAITIASAGLLFSLLIFLIVKCFPFLVHSTIYYCQSALGSINLQTLPRNLNLLPLAVVVFIVGSVGFKLLMTVVQLLLVKQKITNTESLRKYPQLERLIKNLGLEGSVKVFTNNQPLAFCFGFVAPKIYLSSKMLSIISEQELHGVLEHEKHHLESKDNFTMMLAQLLESTFPFVPLISELVRNYRTEREIAADQAAMRAIDKQHVVSALRKLLVHEYDSLAFIPALASTDTLETRVNVLTHSTAFYAKYSLYAFGVSVISLGLLLFLALTPVQAVEYHRNGMDGVMACLDNQQCATTCSENSGRQTNMNSVPIINASMPVSPVRYSSY
ncbi:MAG: hypothetical protein UX85_C0009G0028 [Candidatus Beckwithbacteria bacterium GW2011_GWB1_47_15]|uniref:Peptidase M56 domain-containing protein n=2 Tax=Bacteria candidate phyla TaxID=1783234 RepID=A0A0G1US73_9BACT|nr:MAG: hypothetical protein UW18_C0003G0028 [Microgenomates group bacterium GW2011_GWF1_44_10]KKU02431.1 MAG: hypothetical protein UX04_C0001G0202 [Microgenomates group bacterium GW2011_GWF2_45_18]KKU60575.1 MAG: hypothetical protein UX85_C0009G0028 [Candidatus Beckwithbacteria bacterium GW2011_GWB1_47_15]OGC56853.1 MAG: hypothetical protein A2976_04110 [candidate division WWE3 bacterium RIFCSPLOWO2_01_FULL_41_9]